MDFCNLRKIIFTKNYLRLNLLPLQRLHSLEFPPGSVENEITNICVLTVALLPVLDIQISLHGLLDPEPDQGEQGVLGQSQSLAGLSNLVRFPD